jgi:hypothetical protein
MKFAFVIAALFVASAIAAPCGKKHVEVSVDNTDDVMVNDPVDAAVDDSSAPETDAPALDDTPAQDDTPAAQDDTPAAPAPESNSDHEEEVKSSEVNNTNEQTAVINNNSGEKSKGSLFGGLDVSDNAGKRSSKFSVLTFFDVQFLDQLHWRWWSFQPHQKPSFPEQQLICSSSFPTHRISYSFDIIYLNHPKSA